MHISVFMYITTNQASTIQYPYISVYYTINYKYITHLRNEVYKNVVLELYNWTRSCHFTFMILNYMF